MEPDNPRLDLYILSLAKKRSPRVCFVATASGDSADYVRRFHAAFEKHSCRPTHVSLFERGKRDPAEIVLEQDIIYVGGGSTANLLAIWRLHGIDKAMRTAWRHGIILCGISAGMNCWFESSVTDSFGPLQPLNDGLGLIAGSACPHYDGEPERRPTYHRLILEGNLPAGVAADDGAAIHFIGRKIYRCIASRPRALAYAVRSANRTILEEPLTTVLLRRDGDTELKA